MSLSPKLLDDFGGGFHSGFPFIEDKKGRSSFRDARASSILPGASTKSS